MKVTKHILTIVGILIVALGVNIVLPAQTRPQAASAAVDMPEDSGKCYTTCSDPNRPSYDMWGNQWSYDGKLLRLGQCPYTDPISHQANPECPAPAVAPSQPTVTTPPASNQCGGSN